MARRHHTARKVESDFYIDYPHKIAKVLVKARGTKQEFCNRKERFKEKVRAENYKLKISFHLHTQHIGGMHDLLISKKFLRCFV